MRTLESLYKSISFFFFEKKSSLPLAIFRIAFGIFLLYFFASTYWFLKMYYGPHGLLFSPVMHDTFSGQNIFLKMNPALFPYVFAGTIVITLFFTCGIFTRFSSVALWGLLTSWEIPLTYGTNSADLIIRTLAFLFMIAALAGHAQRTLSIDFLISKYVRPLLHLRPLSFFISAWTTRLFQIQLVFIYFFTAISKIVGIDWYDGTALYYVFNQSLWSRFDLSWLTTMPVLIGLATYSSLLLELIMIPVLVWPRKTRIPILFAAFFFHLTIGIMMRIIMFTELMPVFYLCFLEDYHIEAMKRKSEFVFRRIFPRTQESPLILFDGVCNLCNTSIQFIIRHDPEHYFRFATLQSKTGGDILHRLGKSTAHFDAMILVKGDKVYEKSSAALKIASSLYSPWPIFSFFLVVPRFIRDGVYDFIARNRYQWFGKQNTCMVLTPELEKLFLD